LIRLVRDGGDLEWGCSKPSPLKPETWVCYIAAVLNNLVMTHGARRVHLAEATPYAQQVIERVWKVNQQCVEAIWKRSPSSDEALVMGLPRTPTQIAARRPRLSRKAAETCCLGIDIGNSNIKIALRKEDGNASLSGRPTPRIALSQGPLVFFGEIEELISRQRRLLSGQGEELYSVGVGWFGDALHGRPLTQAADLAPWDHAEEAAQLASVPQRLAEAAGCPVHFYGDSEVLGRCLGELGTFSNTYVLILGTSTGGFHLGSDGRYGEGVNLVSRIIVDLADGAPRHHATGVPGVFQRYSGSYGILRAFEDEFAEAPEPSGAGALLDHLLRSKDEASKERAHRCLERYAGWMASAIVDLWTHYPMNETLITGGMSQGSLGSSLKQKVQSRLDAMGVAVRLSLLAEKTGWEPSHEVAMAAATLAALSSPGGAP